MKKKKHKKIEPEVPEVTIEFLASLGENFDSWLEEHYDEAMANTKTPMKPRGEARVS